MKKRTLASSPPRELLRRGCALLIALFVLAPLLLYGVFNEGSLTALLLAGLLVFWGRAFAVLDKKWRKLIMPFAAAAIVLMAALSGAMLYAALGRAPAAESFAPAIVLGCQVRGDRPSKMLARRLDAAFRYALEHPGAPVIVSGGQGSNEQYSESSVMKRYLIQKGLDPQRIIEESASSNTGENIRFSAHILRERGLGEEVVIITDGYHQLRAWFFARQAGLSSRAVSSRSPFGMTMVFAVREWLALAKAVILRC